VVIITKSVYAVDFWYCIPCTEFIKSTAGAYYITTILKHRFTADVLFRILFQQYKDLLKHLVSQLRGIQLESIEEFEVTSPVLEPQHISEKFCHLDINMKIDGQLVDLEVQVGDEGNFEERSLFYWARQYASALESGNEYINLPKTYGISILDYSLIKSEKYHTVFSIFEKEEHILLTDKLNLIYFELPKASDAVDATDELGLWLALFKAKTEEGFKAIEVLEVPIMNQAIAAYNTVVASEKFRHKYIYRAPAR